MSRPESAGSSCTIPTRVPRGSREVIQAFFVAGSGFTSSNSTVFGSTLTINPVGLSDVGSYDVVVTSGNCSQTSTAATLTIPTCDDGDLCTIDTCVGGVCVFTPITCDDGDPCTTDTCVGGVCVFTPIVCNDGDPCTTDDTCVSGACLSAPVECAPIDSCHLPGTCDVTTGLCSSPVAPDGAATPHAHP